MKTMTMTLAMLLFASPILAQDEVGAGEAEFDRIIAALAAEQDAYRAAVREVTATEAYRKLLETWRATEDQEERATIGNKLRELRAGIQGVDMVAYRERIKGGAGKYEGTEGAVPFLIWLATRGEAMDKAVDQLLSEMGEGEEPGSDE